MDRFLEQLELRAATIDELLSDSFCSLKGEKADADLAVRRLAAWCRSSASGDWELFARRLAKDELTLDWVIRRLATVRRTPAAPIATWLADAEWIWSALRLNPDDDTAARLASAADPQPFEHLLFTTVAAAEREVRSRVSAADLDRLTAAAWGNMVGALVARLAKLCAPALYECFLAWSAIDRSGGRSAETAERNGDRAPESYADFVAHMRQAGLAELFDAKPVLLRLIASVTRQWIESTGEFVARLASDLAAIRQLVGIDDQARVASIVSGLSDPHNFGRSVLVVSFDDRHRVVYKPKDMRVDAFWHELVEELNAKAAAPAKLLAARVLVRNGYGWSEFIEHSACADRAGLERFFYRAGAWVALFHVFAATDMHEENIIAAGDHPVPIDLEMVLQGPRATSGADIPDKAALELAIRRIADSVVMTGLLPAYGRSPENRIYRWGGLNDLQLGAVETCWEYINTSLMRPTKRNRKNVGSTNFPRLDGSPATLSEFLRPLVAGFEAYAEFLWKSSVLGQELFRALAGVPVRTVLRPTRFYYLLLERLKDHRNMSDGAEWSSHLDFLARLSDLDNAHDDMWPLARAERNALADLNVPFFATRSDAVAVTDRHGITGRCLEEPGLSRVQRRLAAFDVSEIRWQRDVILASMASVTNSFAVTARSGESSARRQQCAPTVLTSSEIMACAADVAAHLTRLALRSGSSAAWIGLDWLGDSEVCQLSPVGFDLYGGAPGISLFLAAYSKVAGSRPAAELALAAVAPLRCNLRGAGSARFARGLGLGGASGMGSIIYALTVLSELLDDGALLGDARLASSLLSDELIAADRSFDVIGGSAGGILGLLKLYRATGDGEVLARAIRCGEHLLKNRPGGVNGRGMWVGQGMGPVPLTGMSHGAAGFAYALAALHAASGSGECAIAADECIDFENSYFCEAAGHWRDPRKAGNEAPYTLPCQWCHGAGGIGHARIGMLQLARVDSSSLVADVEKAVRCVEQAWPYPGDSFCCGNLGNIELLNEAGRVFRKQELRDKAAQRLMSVVSDARRVGDYRWAAGDKRFNLGLFRGIAGVGYTLLRQASAELPNVLIWQ